MADGMSKGLATGLWSGMRACRRGICLLKRYSARCANLNSCCQRDIESRWGGSGLLLSRVEGELL